MHREIVIACVVFFLLTSNSFSHERIDPNGIVGTLLLSPIHSIDSKHLREVSGDADAANLCIVVDENSTTESNPDLISAWSSLAASELTIVRIRNELNDFQRQSLMVANVIWVASDSVQLPRSLGRICKERLASNRSVILTGNCVALAFNQFQLSPKDPKQIGWKLIPDSNLIIAEDVFDESLGSQLRTHGLLFSVNHNASLLFEGRRFRATNSHIGLQVMDENHHRKSVKVVDIPADLTALRRSLRKENIPPFQTDSTRTVPNGSLIIVGGGRLPSQAVKRFIEDAGGDAAKIVIFPTSLPDPIPDSLSIEKTLRKEGVQSITVLRDREISAVESAEFLAAIDDATAIWFNGGRQWRFVDAYQNTAAEPAINRLLERGGVIGGSSAGASIQGEYLARGNPLGNLDIMAAGYERGLGFLPGVAIDQHFTQRNRLPQLKQLVQRYPQYLGIGIDESTAIYVKESIAETMGKGQVFYLNMTDGELQVTEQKDGQRFDLNALIPIQETEVTP